MAGRAPASPLKRADTSARYAIVAARFNEAISERLVNGARHAFAAAKIPEDRVDLFWVPGSFELPQAAHHLALTGRYAGIVCLGVVIRGQTPHFDLVAAEIARSVARAGFDTGVPVTFGVLTTDTLEQAVERAGAKSGNKGWDAALAAIEMVQVLRDLKRER